MSTLVSVLLSTSGSYAGIRYAFRRSKTVSDADGTTLGHQAMTGADPVANLIMASQNPKPSRASRKRATGFTSSFVSASAIVSAGNAGWSISPPKRDGGRARLTQFTIVVYVTLNGIKYAWNIRKTLYAKIKGSLESLGVKVAKSNDDLVFGATFPKPPQVQIHTVQGVKTLTTSSFYDPSNEASLSANFSTKKGRYTAAQWASVAK
jgi:hypothetical protein